LNIAAKIMKKAISIQARIKLRENEDRFKPKKDKFVGK